MKILITGIRNFSAGVKPKKKNKFAYVNNCNTIVNEIIEQGHEVSWRPIIPGENLNVFDKTIAFIEEIIPWGAIHTPSVLYMLHNRPDSILIFSDTHGALNNVQKQFSSKLRSKNFIFRSPGFFRNDELWRNKKYENILRNAAERLASDRWGEIVYFPAISSDNADLSMLPADKVITYDSSPIWYEMYKDIDVDYSTKKRQWVFAALQPDKNWIKKYNFTWDRLKYGDKKSELGRLPERQTNEIFADSWGILINSYKNIGSGYIRYKYVACAQFGCIPFGDVGELSLIGPMWRWCANNLEKIEQLNNVALRHLHLDIREEFYNIMWTKEQFKQFVSDMLEK
jgi:hypothetical protein